MTVTYRDATGTDLAAVDALFRASFTATFGHLYRRADYEAFMAGFSPQAWAAELARPDLAIRLAEEGGDLVGYAKIGKLTLPVDAARPAIELRQLYLSDAAKGRGIADALTAWVVDLARTRRAGEIFLSVYCDNHRAKRFYARHGFVDIGRYVFMVGTHADHDRLMRKSL